MTPSRRLSNGRSPLVRKQSQITSFFTPGKTPRENPSPSFSPSPSPNPNPSPDPSPSQGKPKKPLLVIAPSPISNPRTPPSAEKKTYSEEVVGKRVRVFWPLDKTWYEGCVKSFDELSGKHLVQYDDAEEEALDLGNEKIEWVDEPSRSFRRLRRMSGLEKTVQSKGSMGDRSSGDDSTDDEDWGKELGKDAMEDDSEEVELDEEEEEEEEDALERSRKGRLGNSESRKRKKTDVEKLDSVKTSRINKNGEKSPSMVSSNRSSTIGPVGNVESE